MTTYGDHLFSQQFSSVTVLPVTHSLNSKNLEIRIINSEVGGSYSESIEPIEIIYGTDSLNEFTVFFSGSSTGYIEISETGYYEPRFLIPEKIKKINELDLDNLGGGEIDLDLTSSYITFNDDTSDLPNSRRLLQGTGVQISTFGANGVRFQTDPSIIPRLDGANAWSEPNTFNGGISGSLTTLANGDPYIIGGTDVSTTINNDGSITIANRAAKYTWEEEEFAPQNIAGVGTFSTQLQFTPADTSSIGVYVNGILQRQDLVDGTYTVGGANNRFITWRGTNPSGFPIDTNDCVVVKYRREL